MSNLNYKITGTPNSPFLIFSNSLGSTYHMWDSLIPYLLPYFKVLQVDTRGHGGSYYSEDPASFSIKLLAEDLISLMDQLKIEKAYFCGLSMGGLIGQYLGIYHSDRFHKIVLSNTGAKIGDNERWNTRITTIKESGMQAIVEDTMVRWFSESFLVDFPNEVQKSKEMFLSSPVPGYAACCAAIRDADFRSHLSKIEIETLVITGDNDPVTNIDQAKNLVENIPNATLKILSGKHLIATEIPEVYSQVLIDFLVGESTYEKGIHIRKTVLGHEHVNRSLANKNSFNEDFQDFISKYAWGEVWSRPGLNKAQRSMITVAMLIALNKPEELKMHLKAAFNNGLNKKELKEIILHAALYCGLPASNEAMHLAESVFEELEI